MIIRKACIDDLDALTLLFDAYRVFYKKESNTEDGKAFLKERILNNESEIFISLSEDEIITGFVQLYPIFSSTRLKRLWLLNDLFVSLDYRGGGVSKLLINAAKKLCNESGSCGLILETAETNEVANNLYVKAGLSLDTEHNYYYWDTK